MKVDKEEASAAGLWEEETLGLIVYKKKKKRKKEKKILGPWIYLLLFFSVPLKERKVPIILLSIHSVLCFDWPEWLFQTTQNVASILKGPIILLPIHCLVFLTGLKDYSKHLKCSSKLLMLISHDFSPFKALEDENFDSIFPFLNWVVDNFLFVVLTRKFNLLEDLA